MGQNAQKTTKKSGQTVENETITSTVTEENEKAEHGAQDVPETENNGMDTEEPKDNSSVDENSTDQTTGEKTDKRPEPEIPAKVSYSNALTSTNTPPVIRTRGGPDLRKRPAIRVHTARTRNPYFNKHDQTKH